jgi:sodium/hydrogen exchanger 8
MNPSPPPPTRLLFAPHQVVSIGSCAIGVMFGLLSALLYKHINMSHNHNTEMAAYYVMAYIPFLFAEAFEFSGIVAILFAGIITKHYTHNNLSKESRNTANHIFELLATLAETAVFLDLGLSVFSLQKSSYKFGLIVSSCVLCLAGRGMHVYPLSYLLNRFVRSEAKPIQV